MQKCSDQFILFAKLDQIANPIMITKKVRRNLNMIEQFMEVANLESCKKWAKTALIDLQHLTVLNPRKNRVVLAKFHANWSKGF